MSVFYDEASLVVVPSGYKSGKIYAQKPLTTDGQLTFTRASTATRVNASGLIEEVASGVPRLDYTNSTCPKLLLEPQRTNLVTYSEQFDNAAWTKNGATISANAVISPDGLTTADKIIESAANSSHDTYQSFVSLSSSIYTASVFVKKGERFKAALADRNTGAFVAFNLNTGTIISSSTLTGKIEAYGNDWYRISVTSDTALTIFVPQVFILEDSYTTGLPILLPYTGDGTSGLYVWGAQFEAGAYGTSYVKTEAAAVTRVGDTTTKSSVPSLLGQSEGTLYAEVHLPSDHDSARVLAIQGGNNRLGITVSGTTSGFFIVTGAGGVVFSSTAAVTGPVLKMALGYKSGDCVLYVNGTAILSTSATFAFDADITNIFVGTFELSAGTGQNGQKQAETLIFKNRLSNDKLAEITTL